MRKMKLKLETKRWMLAVVSFMVSLGGIGAISYADVGATVGTTMDTAKEHADNVLNSIEDYFQKTGLPDLRKQINDQYQLYIKPYFKTQYELTNNVFKAPDDHSDHTDNIWSFIPGLQFVHKNKYGVFGGAYEATFRYFTQFHEQNQQDQKFLVYANLRPHENIYVNASERLQRLGATAGSSAFEPIEFLDNTVNTTVGVIHGTLTHEFGYENFDRDFKASSAKRFSHQDNTFSYTLYHNLTDRVRVYGAAKIGTVHFFKLTHRDTTWIEFPIGIQGDLVLGWTGNVSAGWHHRNLEDSDQNDIKHIVANISVSKNLNEDKSKVTLGFLRRPVESTFSTATTYDEKLWHASGQHLITEKLRGRASIYYANRDFEDSVFTGPRVVGPGGVILTLPTSFVKRTDQAYGFGVGFDYSMRSWLIFHLDYRHERRDSNISPLDYTENAMVLKTSMPL